MLAKAIILSLALSLTHSPVCTHRAQCVVVFTAGGECDHMGRSWCWTELGPEPKPKWHSKRAVDPTVWWCQGSVDMYLHVCVWMRGCVYIRRWVFVSVCLCVAWAITCLFVCLNSKYVRQEPVDCVSVWPVDPLSYSQGQGGITQVTQQQQGMANCLCLHDFTLQLLHLHVLRLCFWHCSCLISPL